MPSREGHVRRHRQRAHERSDSRTGEAVSAPPDTCTNCGAPVELSGVVDAEAVARALTGAAERALFTAQRDASRLRDFIRAAMREGAIYTCGTTTCLHPRCAAGRALMEAVKCQPIAVLAGHHETGGQRKKH